MQASESASTDTLIDQGIAAARAGDRARAYDLLARALATSPRDERGWLWLSGVVASDAERYYCLEQVLTIDPRNAAAQRGLAMLPRGVAPTSPLPAPAPDSEPPLRQAAAATATTASLGVFLLPALTDDLPIPAHNQAAPVVAPAPSAEPQAADAMSSDRTGAPIDVVVRELGAGRTADEVSRLLCERHGYAWPDAQQLVAHVAGRHGRAIARRQAPFLLFLGVATLAGGLILIGFAVLRYYYPPSYIFSLPRYHARIAAALFGGVVMVLGSAIGIGQVVKGMWK